MSAENVEWYTLYPNKALVRFSESGPWNGEMADTILKKCSMLIMVVIVLSSVVLPSPSFPLSLVSDTLLVCPGLLAVATTLFNTRPLSSAP